MKVVVLGGYGVFGSRLATLLCRDGHTVWAAGRHPEKAQMLVAEIGAQPMAVDLHGAPEAIFDPAPDVVVDAAGPFRACGDDPYAIPRLCLEHGADYLDLSDDAGFTSGLAALDEQARACGRRLLSGASSVPGISSAAVVDLSRDLDDVLVIDTSILPGNRAPRGRSVIASIVEQIGTPVRVWRGGMWRDQRCWSDPRRVRLARDMVRTAYFIEVPDIRLFPGLLRARSVVFRAGMELRVLNAGLRALAAIRRIHPFAVTPRRARLLQACADVFRPFGSDRGGMCVAVVGQRGDQTRLRTWRLVAEGGSGPYIPAVVARGLIDRMNQIGPGARPCLAELSLSEITAAMADLDVTTSYDEQSRQTLFQAALADRWSLLPPAVQALHSVQDMESFSGTAEVIRGSSWIARLAARIFGFPHAAEHVPVTVTKIRTDRGEIWQRDFDGRIFQSYCSPSSLPYRYRERFGPFNYEQDLPVDNGCMYLTVRRGWFLGMPIPRALLPGSDSREYADNGVFHFDVGLLAPLGGGLIVRYRGWLKPDRASPRGNTRSQSES